MKILRLLTPFLCLGALSAGAQTILSTDFSNANNGSYANNNTIGSAPATGQIQAIVSPSTSVEVVSSGEGHAVNLTDNGAATSGVGLFKTFQSDTFVAANGGLTGSLTFTPLALSSGSRSYLSILLNSGNLTTPGSMTTAIQLYLKDNLQLQYYNGVNVTSVTLSTDTQYRIDFSMDFTNLSDEKWQFSLYQTGNATALYSSGLLDTRADINPNPTGGNDNWTLAIQGGAFTTGASPDPYVRIDGVSLAAVPEPAVFSLLALGALAMVGLRRRTAA